MQNETKSLKKKKLKKIVITVASVVLVVAVIAGVGPFVLNWIHPKNQTVNYDDLRFFEPDYEKNIFEDDLYMSLRRGIHYNRYGNECVLTEDNVKELPTAAGFFYEYLNCIIRGDYENYPNFYTDKCKNDANFQCPEKFTMQGLYDIHVDLYSVSGDEETGAVTEVYEVRYRIFENNGTYRKDILPDETRTRVFELVIINGEAKINSITYRQTIK